MDEKITSDPRLMALAQLGLMGSPPEERFDRITRAARDLFGVPIAEIHLLNDTTLYTKSPQYPGVPTTYEREGTFCNATLRKGDTLVLPDLRDDPEFAEFPVVAEDPHLRFYAGRPLTVQEGQQVGTLCILDFAPRELTSNELELLDEFGHWVERELQDTVDHDRAAEIQTKLAPGPIAVGNGYSLVGLSLPFHRLAGDFYSWKVGTEFIDCTVADVMGKGAGAAILAASVRSAFQARAGAPPADVMAAVNEQLLDDFAATDSFATLFHGRLEQATGRFEFVDAGHGLTVVLRADGDTERLTSLGLPIGIAADGGWIAQVVDLRPGDTIVSITDGLLDLYDGTLQSLTTATDLVRESTTEEYFATVRRLAKTGHVRDDITVLVIRRD